MPDRSMNGIYPILSMPFDEDDRIDEEDLKRETQFAIDSGVHGVGIAMASEVYKLSEAERDLATTTVVEQAHGQVKVVVNTGSQGTSLALQYSHRAEELGADAVMVAPPNIIAPSADELVEYFGRIARAITIPIFMQDFATAPIPPTVAGHISKKFENACYAKVEAPPTPPRVAATVREGDGNLIVFGGAGGTMLLEELRRGAVGTMPHCAVPELFRKVWDAFQSGSPSKAENEFSRMCNILRIISQGGGASSLAIVKEILKLRGIFKTSQVRHPATSLDKITLREIRSAVENSGVTTSTNP